MTQQVPEPPYSLTQDQTHNRFSATIPPVLTVPSAALQEVNEALGEIDAGSQ